MKAFFWGIVLGIIIGAVGLWWLQERQMIELPQSAQQAKKITNAQLEALDLQADQIRKELAETGEVVRRHANAIGEKVAGVVEDTAVTAAVKAKLAASPDLSALAISVTTHDGVVTLSGTVASPELVGRAILLALGTNGVREVNAKLEIAEG